MFGGVVRRVASVGVVRECCVGCGQGSGFCGCGVEEVVGGMWPVGGGHGLWRASVVCVETHNRHEEHRPPAPSLSCSKQPSQDLVMQDE